eukprot:GHUV01048209.1.p1 GENE.GHUV01048209.1~~GHUV01048209.1.p1  ORF type:complete len:101 (-),score=11.58 GHUV01048209.1:312-614(-)
MSAVLPRQIWEVQWGRDGYKGLSRVMDLKGHSSQVMSVAFNADGSRTITASKDGTLRIWNTAVRYHLQVCPRSISTLLACKGMLITGVTHTCSRLGTVQQ